MLGLYVAGSSGGPSLLRGSTKSSGSTLESGDSAIGSTSAGYGQNKTYKACQTKHLGVCVCVCVRVCVSRAHTHNHTQYDQIFNVTFAFMAENI